MSTLIKYRVHEVAKDFKMNSKDIAQILTEYATTPKNHMQVLEENELDLIFEYLTQHNQVADLAEVFAMPEKPSKPVEEPVQKAPEQQTPARDNAPVAQRPDQQRPVDNRPRPEQQHKPADNRPHTPRAVPEKRVIDTRGGTVNIEKYDERLDSLVPDKVQNLQGKEKFINKNKNRPVVSQKRRQEEKDKLQKLQFELAKKAPVKVAIPDEINVGELASRMKKTGAEVVRQLIKLGTMASMSDTIDYETAALVALEMGCKVEKEVRVTVEERLIDGSDDRPEDLIPRAPVVVVMGHVDHGKTSLLDRIREANVASGEAGGITQHIGAYRIQLNGSPITFLDTPGHEAFTSMRARGAMVTDIAILVVAADDGIMPQTVESINHAKAAGIPIIVAINKMDKPSANPDRIKQQLTEYGLVSEEWGGDTIICPISAKTGMGIEKLLEMVVLTAEMRELKANPSRSAKGAVIEARLDKGRGPIMTVLVQNGTLRLGDIIIAGTAVGHARVMVNDKGERVTEAGPPGPV